MTTPHQAPNADDFLMGGGGPATAKFPTLGHTVTGRITQKPTVEQQRDYDTEKPLFWDDGNPRMQLVVTLATTERDPENPEDDGARRLFVKANLKTAVATVVRQAGGKGLEVGGVLTITYSGNGEQSNPKKNPPKLYTATYTPAATAALHTPDPGMQPSTPAPQQYAPPPAQQQYAPAAPAPQQYVAPPAQQLATPAVAALVAQQQAQAAATPPLSPPPF